MSKKQPIRYGDVFPVVGDLANQPVAPRDAALMQSAESTAFGQTLTAAMESAAMINEHRRTVGHDEFSDIPSEQGVTVEQSDIPGHPGRRLATEFIAGQAVRQYVVDMGSGTGSQSVRAGGGNQRAPSDKITIGEALEATAKTAGNKPVQASDAAAIQAEESRATRFTGVLPGGVATAAQAAPTANAWVDQEEEKTKLRDVLEDAMVRIPADKAVTRADVERVAGAEKRNSPNLDTVAAAARLNEPKR